MTRVVYNCLRSSPKEDAWISEKGEIYRDGTILERVERKREDILILHEKKEREAERERGRQGIGESV